MDSNNSDNSNNSNNSNIDNRSTKALKRCPNCNSSNIYKRVRHAWNQAVKPYRCQKCKHEFNVPVMGEKVSVGMERIW